MHRIVDVLSVHVRLECCVTKSACESSIVLSDIPLREERCHGVCSLLPMRCCMAVNKLDGFHTPIPVGLGSRQWALPHPHSGHGTELSWIHLCWDAGLEFALGHASFLKVYYTSRVLGLVTGAHAAVIHVAVIHVQLACIGEGVSSLIELDMLALSDKAWLWSACRLELCF
jgi:hypothetical protein